MWEDEITVAFIEPIVQRHVDEALIPLEAEIYGEIMMAITRRIDELASMAIAA